MRKSIKYSKMTYKQEMKEALKAIRCYEKEKKVGKLKILKKVSELWEK